MHQAKRNNTDYLDFVESKFNECFSKKGYFQEQPVEITSQVDPTIDFIGSKISPLKKYIISNNIPEQGIYLIQNSMKLKSLQYLKTDIPQKFGCYYKCMGTLTKPKLEQVVYDTFDYLTNPDYLNIPLDDIHIKICSSDEDLLNAIQHVDKGIKREIDTVDLKHYRHKYGMDNLNITGRDFNIGIRKKGANEFFNCATFVLMENQDKPIAIDMGLGNSSLAMCKFGLNSTVESSRMADIIQIDSIEKSKFADALIAVSILLKENILEHPSKHFRKKFRQYLSALMYWNQQYKFSEEELVEAIIKFLNIEYKSSFEEKQESWVKVLKR